MKPWMVIAAAVALVAAGGCARQDTRVFAQDKQYVPGASAAPWRIGGVFDKEELTVVISVNGENVLRGRFPPYTPRLTVQGSYDDKPVGTLCKFSTDVIARKRGGWQERLAESIVAKTTDTGGNTCEVTVEGRAAATLYF